MCEGHLFEYGRARGSRIRRPNTKDHVNERAGNPAFKRELLVQEWSVRVCAQSVRNRAARDHSGLHQSRDASRCKLQKILMRLGLEKSSVTLKIRRYLVPWGFDSPSRHQQLWYQPVETTDLLGLG